jgi:hypothetical protein
MDPFSMVVVIVALSLAAGTVHKYMDMRARMGGGDRNALRAIEELRAEFKALKQHESEAILTFDSTLQNLDTRLKHLEQRMLTEGGAARSSLGAGPEAIQTEEPARVTVKTE